MRAFLPLLVLAGCTATTGGQDTAATEEPDPYLWLEDVEGDRALTQVRTWNAATAAKLARTEEFAAYRERALEILSDPERIELPTGVYGDRVFNFWTDAEHTHGLWRSAALDDYLSGDPEWRVHLDLDALSEVEGRNWVWQSAKCLAPEYRRCLLQLSDGGSDAGVIREFDLTANRFVTGGFTAPTAKHDITWVDADSVLLSSDFGPGTLTDSGYGRQLRLWRRGTPPEEAEILFEAARDDVGFNLSTARTEEKNYAIAVRSLSFWDYEYRHIGADGAMTVVPIPQTASVEALFGGHGIVKLNEDWGDLPAGALVAYDIENLLAGGNFTVRPIFVPTATQSVQDVEAGADRLYVALLDNVNGRLIAIDDTWRAAPVNVPANSVIKLRAAGGKQDIAFFTAESMTRPPRLFASQNGGEPQLVDALEPVFDPDSVEVSQRFATSSDGTRIPYYVARPTGAAGPLPTVVHAYGGFRSAQLPVYLTQHPYRIGPMALFWIEEGGQFVLANIRGGGEFGPEWHESVLKENRQKVFDDYYAVAEALKADGLASTIAASGRSNGGLLVGAAYTQRPDLYDGVIMGVPLSDMKRYNKLLAGASWMGEYGNPDVPGDWAYIREYSPYQNIERDADYPDIMIYTSTKDDRVHPAHARKMAARMAEYGHDFYYYENIEGGHAGAANHEEEAYRAALMMAYANEELKAD